MTRHVTTKHWLLPKADRPALPAPFRRVNLRELEARPGRFEHHLMVVGTVGVAQLEVATASEPLYSGHVNISDEYVLPMETGDVMADAFPFRTFLTAAGTGEDVGRFKHRVNQVVLHPYGLMHWPGRLRPPFAPFDFAPGMRRTGMTLVVCASKPTKPPAPPARRELFVSEGNEGATKAYGGADVPFLIADIMLEPSRRIATVGDVTVDLVVAHESFAPKNGGYVVVLVADETTDYFASDLVYVPAGSELAMAGIERALCFESAGSIVSEPPDSWDRVPEPPFAPVEETERLPLPFTVGEMTFTEAPEGQVCVSLGDKAVSVPRYWLARTLFRVALHGYQLAYLETYGGFYYDDRGAASDTIRLGIRGGGHVTLEAKAAREAIAALYRAVAPADYRERVE